MNLSDLVIVVRASTKDFSAGMAKTRAEILKTQTTANRMANVGGAMSKVGGALTKGITLPVIAGGVAAGYMATKFDDSMTLIQTQAGASAKDVKYLTDAVLNMKDVQHSPDELANALYHLKSVGLDNKTAMDALTASEHLASVGQADLESTTNAVAGAYKSGIKGAQNFGQATASLNAIIGAGNLRMDDLNAAMGTGFLVTAKQFGISLNDVGSALAMMTSRGIPATRAATSIKMALSGMAAPSGTAQKVMDKLGLGPTDLAKAMRTGGLPAAFSLLQKHLQGLSKVDQTAALTKMFGARSSQAILTILGNLKDFQRVQAQVEKNATTAHFGEAIAAQAKTPGAVFARLKSSLAKTAVEFGTMLLPAAVAIGKFFQSFVGWLDKLTPAQRKFILIAAGIAAAIGPLLIVVGKMSTGAGAIINVAKAFGGLGGAIKPLIGGISSLWGVLAASPIGWIVLAIAAVVAVFVILWVKCKWFRDFWKAVWKEVVKVALAVWNWMKPGLEAIWQGIKTAWDFVWKWTKIIWAKVGPYVVTLLKFLWAEVKLTVAIIVAVIKVAWTVIAWLTKHIWPLVVLYVRAAILAIKVIVNIIKVVVAIVRGVWNAVAAVTRAVWRVVAFVVRQGVERVVQAVHLVKKVWAAVSAAWNKVKQITGAIWGGIKGVVGGVIEWIWGKIEWVIKKLKGAYDTVKGWIGGSKGAEQNFASGGRGGGLRRPPGYAMGGFIPATNGGQPVIGGDGGEGEWMIPASKAKAFAAGVMGLSGGKPGDTYNINIGEVHGTDEAAARRLADRAAHHLMLKVRANMVGQNV